MRGEPDYVIELLVAATRRRSDDDAPVIRRLTRAGDAPPPPTRAPRSIFDLAQRIGADMHQASSASSSPPPRAVDTVARAGDVVRVRGLAYPGGRWTAERAERERIRRAKQRPPKPGAAVRVCVFGKGREQTR